MEHFVDGAYLRAFGAAGSVCFAEELLRAKETQRIYLIGGTRGALCAQLLGEACRLLRDADVSPLRIVSERRQGQTEGLVLPERGAVLIDAAYPHALTPRFPVAVETTVDTDALTDAATLRRSRSAVELADRTLEKEERRLSRYLAAIGELRRDLDAVVSPLVDTEKLERYVRGFAARELPKGSGTAERPTHLLLASLAHRRLISADALRGYPRCIAVEDAHGAAAQAVFDALTRAALARGLDAVVCRSPLLPETQTEALLLPGAGTAFFCTGAAFSPLPDAERTIHTARFLDREALAAQKNRLSFDKKAVRALSEGASETAERVCDLQDVVDRFYLSAADPEKVRRKAEQIVREIVRA